MCGRAAQAEIDKYNERIHRWMTPSDFVPRHNLRPTEEAWIVAYRPGDDDAKTVAARWWCQRDGATEFEAKLPSFNIRVDTMDEKRLWPPLLKKGKRCIFPIDAFYEWPTKGRGIPPVKIFTADRQPFALAGLWSTWFDNGERRYSFATFTVEPNAFMEPIHPKAMPVILDSIETQKLWLLEGDRDLLVPYTGELIAEKMDDTLERLFPEENVQRKGKEEPQQGSLF